MFRSHSDHLQGARIFLIKVTDFKIKMHGETVKLAVWNVIIKICRRTKFKYVCSPPSYVNNNNNNNNNYYYYYNYNNNNYYYYYY